ncbi:golgi integral membrane protein [Colletotrichum sojae]|uniref:Protein BTN n=1 Tax=Colletotrichum sojae TaxID=2175907 RepID=A0A8H6N109_9PEZI|nr:golgi integral membrane protein [Colletotrichum sojae]
MAPKPKTPVDDVRILLGFALIGLANTVLPAIIHAANYLIVPYPRAVVSFIELLPVVAVKLSLPFVLHRVPVRLRPLLAAAVWVIAKKVADDTPPNVLPPIRVAMSLLAAASSAAMEVSCLGMVGRPGAHPHALLGWGFGTGAGMVGNAVWPFVLAHKAGRVLRSATGAVYYLVVVLLLAHFVVLPQGVTKNNVAAASQDEEERSSFLQDGSPRVGYTDAFRGRLSTLRALARPEMMLLAAASGMLFLQQGSARTLDGSVFGTYSRFASTFGVSLHLGTMLGRSSGRAFPVRSFKGLLLGLAGTALVALLNAVFLLSTYFAFALAFLAGLAGGMVWVNVLAGIAGEKGREGEPEFRLGAVTAGDAVGVLVGGLLGVFVEGEMCAHLVSGRRWCHRSR